ncbi:uncharacterized protein F4812DRAFT_430886 [Daldinia caldariorum]|uniref:uncharacterized protein n=1 Tax=Daldinia caldariorum TaxID=326644 RepID=UPI002008B34F|nr:uncharacterized protein F4812DRAFT_430886 [Daldinia caldariorum]KAI1467035.1 hypothetical protein F4812DRAFT_430886 [Daldinia caldariorum]
MVCMYLWLPLPPGFGIAIGCCYGCIGSANGQSNQEPIGNLRLFWFFFPILTRLLVCLSVDTLGKYLLRSGLCG